MITITAVETAKEYVFTATDGTEENKYEYSWSKEPLEFQSVEEYLQSCKLESEALAQWEIDQKTAPKPINL